MNEQELNQIREQLWRGKPGEAEWKRLLELASRDESLRQCLEEEMALEELTSQMPEGCKVSSNFTAIVMQNVRRENALQNRQANSTPFARLSNFWNLFRGQPLIRMAFPLVIAVAGFSAWQVHEGHQRLLMANQVAFASEAFQSAPQLGSEMESVRQFTASRDGANQPDLELLTLMQ